MARQTISKRSKGNREAYVDFVQGERAYKYRLRRYVLDRGVVLKQPNQWFTSDTDADAAANSFVEAK